MGMTYEKIKIRNIVKKTEVEELEAKVDNGATMLVIPKDVVDKLDFPFLKKIKVKYADEREEERDVVWGVEVELCGRRSVFNAIVDSSKKYALVGGGVLEELDLIIEPRSKRVYPNPRSEIEMAEIE